MTQICEIALHSVSLGQGRECQREANKVGKESNGFYTAQQGQHRWAHMGEAVVSECPLGPRQKVRLFLHRNAEEA